MAPPRKRDSPIEALNALPTEQAILRELRKDAVQHSATLVPLAVTALSAGYLFLLSPFIGGAALAVGIGTLAGVATAGSFAYRFLHISKSAEERIQRIYQENQERVLQLEIEELAQRCEELTQGFRDLLHKAGLKALAELVHEFDGTWQVIEGYQGPDILSAARLKTTVKETYKQGLAVLEHALNLLRAQSADSLSELEAQVRVLKRELQQTTNEEVASRKQRVLERTEKRLAGLKAHTTHIEELFDQSDQLETALEKARLDFAQATADNFTGNAEDIIARLSGIVGTALEVQRMLRRTAGVDAVETRGVKRL